MKRIYAYYNSIALSNQQEEHACANWWKTSWEKNGWECVMLNRSHAQGSTLYNKLQQHLMQSSMGLSPKLATRFDWIVARFIRWCALHATGGGWMSDYDVVNHGFKPDMAEKYEKDGTIHINNGQPAYLFYATKEHAANAIKKFIQEQLVDGDDVNKESDILGVAGDIGDILNIVSHSKQTNDLCRSAVMQTLCDD